MRARLARLKLTPRSRPHHRQVILGYLGRLLSTATLFLSHGVCECVVCNPVRAHRLFILFTVCQVQKWNVEAAKAPLLPQRERPLQHPTYAQLLFFFSRDVERSHPDCVSTGAKPEIFGVGSDAFGAGSTTHMNSTK